MTSRKQTEANQGNMSEWFMKTIMERLDRIETNIPNVKSKEDFPEIQKEKKSQ